MGEKGSTYQIHDRRGQTIHVNNWLPKSILSLRSYTIRLFAADLCPVSRSVLWRYRSRWRLQSPPETFSQCAFGFVLCIGG